uniref:Uncharacterized protein n=1 Tax=Megaselia scalaris TaxID=36166 RepID=T1H1P8_MEGSC
MEGSIVHVPHGVIVPMASSDGKKCCKGCGPGYPTPLEAMEKGQREKLLYTITIQPDLNHPLGDYLSTVDVDPESPTYSQVIHRTFTKKTGNELHHSGWNACRVVIL